MGLPLRNVLVQNVTRPLGADVSDDLPVNPLWAIDYTLRCQQLAASTTTDTIVTLANILANVTRIEVLFRGTTVLSGSLTDLAVLSAILTGYCPYIINQGDATNGARAVTVRLLLGRPRMRGAECFPATRRGELTLHRVFAGAFTNQVTTTVSEQIETVELLGQEPTAYLKAVTVGRTWPAVGDQDLDFPLGNDIFGAVLFGTTGFTALPSTASWSQLKLLVDNVEWQWALANWETLQGRLQKRIRKISELQAHTHTENLAAMYAADAQTTVPRVSEAILDNYGYLDLDEFDDDSSLLETAGRGRVHLRATAGTADAVRMLPLELVRLQARETSMA
jgi:hypothetical protein